PMPNQVVAATTRAAPSRARPMPSLRCIGSRSRALLPTCRVPAPTACATTIQTATIRCPIHSIRITNGLDGAGRCGRPPAPLPFPPLPLPLYRRRLLSGLPFPLAGRLVVPLGRERDDQPAGGVRDAVLPCGRVPFRGNPLLGARVAMLTTVTRTPPRSPQTR